MLIFSWFNSTAIIVHFLHVFHRLFICLQKQVEAVNNDEVEVDIDELLDMDSDEERRRHLQVITFGEIVY